MRIPYRKLQILTILVLTVKLCSPIYGAAYFSDWRSPVVSPHTEFVCTEAGSAASHDSPESSHQVLQCHGLDQPSLLASALIIDYSPAIFTLTLPFRCAMLPGYDPPVYIPPEKHV